MRKKGKMVTPLLTVHKQSLPLRRVNSVSTLSMCRIKGAPSLVTHVLQRGVFSLIYVQQCMLRQDTLTALQVQHILRDKIGGFVWSRFSTKVFGFTCCSFPFHFCASILWPRLWTRPQWSPYHFRNSCRRDAFIDIHYYLQCFFPFIMG